MKNIFVLSTQMSSRMLTCLILLAAFVPAPCAAQEGPPVQQAPQAKIDMFDIKNMDILDVLKLIAQKSGMNIVAGEEVKGRVSVYLADIEPEKALAIILEANGWAYAKEEGIIKVMSAAQFEKRHGHAFGEKILTRIETLAFAEVGEAEKILRQLSGPSGKIITDQKSGTLIIKDSPRRIDEMRALIKRIDIPTQTHVIRLAYANVEELYGKISALATPVAGKLHYDVRSNTLIITDTPAKIAAMTKIIDAFDIQERVVKIDAKIISIALNDEFKWGIDWQAMAQKYHDMGLSGQFDLLTAADKKSTLTIGSIATDSYTAMLEALEAAGKTEILSNPSITALSKQEAKILVGSQEPYVTSTTTTTAAGPSTTAESINFIDVGVKLFVTPTIHKDDFITVKIRPEVSSVVRTQMTSNNNIIPVVETSQAETTVTVKDGATIVIGGLIKEEESTQKNQVPLIGRIPILGLAFRSQHDTQRKTEIVIFLKPTIISGETLAHLP